MSSIQDQLSALFDAERNVRLHHATLCEGDPAVLAPALREATKQALGLEDEAETSVRLLRIASLLGDLDGEVVVDTLIDILGSEFPEGRIAAGEALEGLAFDRFKEVALGIERALTRLPSGNVALTELPFLLAEIAEPGCVKLLGRFLEHADPEAVASAIEALVELGDPSAIPLLAKLERDGRQVHIEDEEGEKGERIAIADLAAEATELLEEMVEELAPPPRAGGKPSGGAPARKPRR